MKCGIYINYLDYDNVPSSGEEEGWVSTFKKYLHFALLEVEGIHATFIDRNNYKDFLQESDDNIIIFIPILSPEYLKSEKCISELEEFFVTAEEHTKGKERIFKIIKTPVDRQNEPYILRDYYNHIFYFVDTDKGTIVEDYSHSEVFKKEFLSRITSLANDIYNSISNSSESSTAHKKVFLALANYDMVYLRDSIRRELVHYGIRVLPETPFPSNPSEHEDFINEQLKEADLAVHIFGKHYYPLDGDRSKVSIFEEQNSLAATHYAKDAHRKKKFKRFIWIPPQLRIEDEKQYVFIESLQRDEELRLGAEIVRTNVEDLKEILVSECTKSQKNKINLFDTEQNDEQFDCYIIGTSENVTEVEKIADTLSTHQLNTVYNDYKGLHRNFRRAHKSNLKNAQSVFIYLGENNFYWLRSIINDIFKAIGTSDASKEYKMVAIICKDDVKLPEDPIFEQLYRISDNDFLTSSLEEAVSTL